MKTFVWGCVQPLRLPAFSAPHSKGFQKLGGLAGSSWRVLKAGPTPPLPPSYDAADTPGVQRGSRLELLRGGFGLLANENNFLLLKQD